MRAVSGPARDGVLAAVVVMMVSGLGIGLTYRAGREAALQLVRTELAQLARTAAALVDGDAHRRLVSPDQMGSPEHLRAIAPLVAFHKATEDVIYVYTAVLLEGRIRFVLGTDYAYRAEGDDLEGVDPIMLEYRGRDPYFRQALEEQRLVVQDRPVQEKHRSYLSAFVPVRDRAGRFVGVLGIDMWTRHLDARLRPIRRSALLASAAAALLAALVGLATARLRQVQEKGATRTRALVENLLEGLVVLTPDFVIEDLNPAAERIFGYRREELVGRSARVLLPDTPEHQGEGYLERNAALLLNRTSERLGRRRNGEVFPIEVQLYDVETPSGKLLAANVRDLSERHEMERLKKQFVSTVSHELRTPLTSLRGSLGLLNAGAMGELPPEARDVLAIAERSTVRLVSLINDILDLERLEAGRLELDLRPIPVREVLDAAVEAVAGMAARHAVAIDSRDGPALVLGDRDRLVQVVVNLLSNAIKFSSEGSRVRLESRRDGDRVRVAVHDEGRGVPPGFREAIFEPFRQVEGDDARVKGGTGLGLAICRAIVERHGGAIGVEAREGPGATFWLTLPAAGPAAVEEERS